jgi:hypothetical protein
MMTGWLETKLEIRIEDLLYRLRKRFRDGETARYPVRGHAIEVTLDLHQFDHPELILKVTAGDRILFEPTRILLNIFRPNFGGWNASMICPGGGYLPDLCAELFVKRLYFVLNEDKSWRLGCRHCLALEHATRSNPSVPRRYPRKNKAPKPDEGKLEVIWGDKFIPSEKLRELWVWQNVRDQLYSRSIEISTSTSISDMKRIEKRGWSPLPPELDADIERLIEAPIPKRLKKLITLMRSKTAANPQSDCAGGPLPRSVQSPDQTSEAGPLEQSLNSGAPATLY